MSDIDIRYIVSIYTYIHINVVWCKKQNGPTNNKRHQHDILTFLGVNLSFTFIFHCFLAWKTSPSRRQPAFSCLKFCGKLENTAIKLIIRYSIFNFRKCKMIPNGIFEDSFSAPPANYPTPCDILHCQLATPKLPDDCKAVALCTAPPRALSCVKRKAGDGNQDGFL